MLNEAELVERIARVIPSFHKAKENAAVLRLGIGDDAAVLHFGANADGAVTTDAFMEGVHFLGDVHPPDSIGYKALARATSDLAAMGATPRFFLLTLGIPEERTGEWLSGFLSGMARAAREFGLVLAGGDTTRTKSVAVSITVLGEIGHGLGVTRSGAKPGDAIYVSGTLGRAQLGLELMRRGLLGERALRERLAPHLYPQIRLKLGRWLAKNRIASAMMDISDGLSTDLARLCVASRLGARIEARAIPSVEIPPSLARRLKKSAGALELALHGGDDYELLFTVPPRLEKKLRKAPGFPEIARIGEITRNRKIALVDAEGRVRKLVADGWDPFRR